jgi:hypothetical protein
MRFSVVETDEGYLPYLDTRSAKLQVRTRLNGQAIDEVVTCDDQLGEVHVIARDEYGEYVIDDQAGFAIERRYGLVEIEVAP